MPVQGQAVRRQRIILLFDGTWNDADFDDKDTNIVRLRELLNDGLRQARHQPANDPDQPARTLVYYRRGVGTDGAADSLRGGAFGVGLAANVRRGYRFLARHYRSGDEVFVFGFSRGAFTARSLVGYLGAVGLLRDAWCTPEREAAAWVHYRTAPDDRSPGEWHSFAPYMHPRDDFRIEALCVFDTVGALGIPGDVKKRENRKLFEFHNVELPSITRTNLHAVAIDEQRRTFEATLWRRHKFKPPRDGQTTEQVWFSGAHSDIGGGYVIGEGRDPGPIALEAIPLDWMLRRLKAHYPTLPLPDGLRTLDAPQLRKLVPHRSRDWKYWFWPPVHRSIANAAVPGLSPPSVWKRLSRRHSLVSRDRHQALAGERVHVSAIERLRSGAEGPRYAPPALVAVLDGLRRAYAAPTAVDDNALLVVGWDGETVSPGSDDAAGVLRAITEARTRLS